MLETVRARLTAWYVSVLAAVLFVVGAIAHPLLSRAIYARIDNSLLAVVGIAVTSLGNDLAEGQDEEDAARSTVGELAGFEQMLAIFDEGGRLLATEGRDDELTISPALIAAAGDVPTLVTVAERDDTDDRHRLVTRRARVAGRVTYVIVAGVPLEDADSEIASLRQILVTIIPAALIVAGIGGWFLARRSLSPVVSMAERARRISAEALDDRLPVANARDELGMLAETFNELLGRLAGSFDRHRQFMADASHELRTPIATTRTAASVALQLPHRDEAEYRETLQIIEDQSVRLSRIVEDLFTLARADAGTYPVRRGPMYLDEVLQEVARATRVLASTRRVAIVVRPEPPAIAFHGDEDLIRRLLGNLLDNAVRHAPEGSDVEVEVTESDQHHQVFIIDSGPGIPTDAQPHVFERFYRADEARRRNDGPDGGAGLGLALARWIAVAHGGDVRLVSSRPGRTVLLIVLGKG